MKLQCNNICCYFVVEGGGEGGGGEQGLERCCGGIYVLGPAIISRAIRG